MSFRVSQFNITSMKKTIWFDGECLLCIRSVKFILRHDRKKQFRFGALQSGLAPVEFLQPGGQSGFQTILYEDEGKLHSRSTAILKIFRDLGGLFSLFYPIILLPRQFRDKCYDLLARNRTKWFGRADSCYVPDEEEKERFVNAVDS